MYAIACLCRPGFEPDVEAELHAKFGALALTQPTPGVVLIQGDATALETLWSRWPVAPDSLCFVRDALPVTQKLDLPRGDRVKPIVAALGITPLSALTLLAPDSEEGKVLTPMFKAVSRQVHDQLRVRKTAPGWRLLFLSSEQALLGKVDPERCAVAPGGVMRLKMPRAPSRSTLKLDEALLLLLTDAERASWLRAGQQACDLGASPGGWTWQLVERGLRVTAIDNGTMDAGLMATGMVKHLREDAFRFQPKNPVDWLVCDVVEQPIRIARLMAGWLQAGKARTAVFNLKLPMKKRWAEVERCMSVLRSDSGGKLLLRARHLYHDREEITLLARRL